MGRLLAVAMVVSASGVQAQCLLPPCGNLSESSANSLGQSSRMGGSSSNAASGASTSVVVATALLLGVGGGISTTVFVGQSRARARARRAEGGQPAPTKKRRRKGDTSEPWPEPEPEPVQQAPQPVQPVEPIPLPDPATLPPDLSAPPLPAPAPGARSTHPLDREPTLDAQVLARTWLLANHLQLRQDLALGAGPAIDDLAGIAGIEPAHRAHFGRVLQRHRAQFSTSPELTPLQAAQVMSRVGDLVMADPLLRPDGDALLASW